MLIKAYGLFWNPDIVEWGSKGAGNKGELLSEIKIKGKKYKIDFWNAKGIYVLHSDFKAIYVGQSFNLCIGKRIRDHLSDRLAGRWDMFSWYSISNPRRTEGDVSSPGQRQLAPEVIVDTLEALGILIADPALNRRREALSGASEAIQPKSAHPRTIRAYLEQLVQKMDEMAETEGE